MNLQIIPFSICLLFCIFLVIAPRYRLAILAAASVMQASLVFTIGSLRIWFYHPVAIALSIIGVYSYSKLNHNVRTQLSRRLTSVCIYLILVSLGAISLPIIFKDTPVFEARGGLDFQDVSQLYPLSFTISNVAQICYLVLAFFVFISVFTIMADGKWGKLLAVFDMMFMLGGAIFVWQFISIKFGYYFPDEFFRGNFEEVAYRTDYLINMNRMNASFGEPADLGLFSAAMFGYGLSGILILNRINLSILFLFLGLIMVVLSGSTTGFVSSVSVMIGLILCLKYVKLSVSKILLLVFLGTSISIGLIQSLTVADFIQTNVAQKGHSESFTNRLFSIEHSINLVKETFGLGVGLGSNRPSSLVVLLISCLGILSLPALWLLYIKSYDLVRSTNPVLQVLYCSYIAILGGVATAIPDLSQVTFSFFTVVVLAALMHLAIFKTKPILNK